MASRITGIKRKNIINEVIKVSKKKVSESVTKSKSKPKPTPKTKVVSGTGDVTPPPSTPTSSNSYCTFCEDPKNILHKSYHDNEWGKPSHNDTHLFEMLTLEGAQAGLSWSTILKKRDSYRVAFDQFDIELISKYDQNKIDELMLNSGIIRNKLKIHSTIKNAQLTLELQKEYGSFDKFLWGYVDHIPIDPCTSNTPNTPTTNVVSSPISDLISKDMKKLGYKFIGTTIMYAFMQAVGMVNSHDCNCIHRK